MSRYHESGTLTPVAPFDFHRSLGFVEMFSPNAGEQHIAAQQLTKAVMVAGQPLAFVVKSSGSLEQPRLDYTLYADQPISADLKSAALDRIRFYLSLDDDLKPFYAMASSDPCLAPIVERLYGLHQVKFITPFEIAAWAILTQRMPIPVARKVKDKIVARYGKSIEVNGEQLWAFPDADQLSAANPDDLLDMIHNERKVQYLGGISQAFQSVDEQFLRSGDYDAVESWLRSIKGVGEWSAK
ncbi:MAG TPA: hypothetical protein VKQ72_09590, partial [Aggregatilineales bacterium]|nr:hypothetical protein [Aggregatilineales bacterium]